MERQPHRHELRGHQHVAALVSAPVPSAVICYVTFTSVPLLSRGDLMLMSCTTDLLKWLALAVLCLDVQDIVFFCGKASFFHPILVNSASCVPRYQCTHPEWLGPHEVGGLVPEKFSNSSLWLCMITRHLCNFRILCMHMMNMDDCKENQTCTFDQLFAAALALWIR
jgi:hypothetical protein